MSKIKHLKIFENRTNEQKENTLLWNEYSGCIKENSILDYIEENSKRIRKKFLQYHNNISNLKYRNKDISDIFCIDKKFSFWWVAQFNEKNLFLSNSLLINLVKIIALKEITSKKKIKKISFFFINDNLKNILELYCKSQNIKFYSYKQKNKTNLFQ